MAHRLKSKFDSRGRPGVESLWGQRTSRKKKFGDKEVRGQRCSGKKEALESSSLWGQRRSGTEKFGDKDVRGQRRQRRAGEALESSGSLWGQRSSGTKKIGDREVWGQRRSGTKEAEESRGTFGDKEVWGQRRQGRAGEPPGTKKSGDKGGRLSHPSNPAGTLAGIPAGSSLIKSLKV